MLPSNYTYEGPNGVKLLRVRSRAGHRLRVTQELAEELDKDYETRLLKDEKLILLVDLDQTLIDTTNEPPLDGMKDVFKYQLYGPNSPWYFTKLRPHTFRFLENISKLYELHICTFGARIYAHKIAELIDPNQKYFSHRIHSRDECYDPASKTGNLKALFPCGESLVCIIDDRQDVWNFASNLVAVKPYFYFKNNVDINSPHASKEKSLIYEMTKVRNEADNFIGYNQEPLSSTSETKHFIEDTDDYLLYLEDILQRIHKTYFQHYKDMKRYVTEEEGVNIPDLKKIIPLVRKKTLQSVNIVFSGLIPTNMPPEKSQLYSMASSLGANVTKDLIVDGFPSEKTTHVVASKLGTLKVSKAMRCENIHIVNPYWLYCCSERWIKVDEILFKLKKEDNFDAIQEKPKPSPSPTSVTGFNAVPFIHGDSPSPHNLYDSVAAKNINPNFQKENREPAESRPIGATNALGLSTSQRFIASSYKQLPGLPNAAHQPQAYQQIRQVQPMVSSPTSREPKRFPQSTCVWFDNDDVTPPQPPPRRRSVSSASSLTPTHETNEYRFGQVWNTPDSKSPAKPIKSQNSQQGKLKEIHELVFASPGRVKEHAQKLNKIVSSSDIKPPMPVNINSPPTPVNKGRSKDSNKEDDNDSASVQPFDPLKRKWMITTSNCDYNEMVSLLKKDPTLAGLKDFTSVSNHLTLAQKYFATHNFFCLSFHFQGYTALHWAAKFGKAEIIKLIAGTHGVNVNKKSHGGYTPLHLAAIHNHEHILELFKIYGADTSIRDYSGKLAEQYSNRGPLRTANLNSKLSNGSLNGSQHKHHSSSSHNHTKITDKGRSESSSSSSSAFIRIGSLNKMRKTAAAIKGIKSWGSAESVSDSNTMPPPKSSTSKKKRSKKTLSSPPMDKIVSSSRDSDSDSAYGFV
ncbi:RNA polymerase II subunit A C-terminal domain phosphatase isoform X1 [Tetranychus urticae]|uniref:RNA polymerase II subunit A C-terminal domain phosphatase isoform X1 n=1 Tax=Tetranychus urticae TaxID=32264 RepID=UPI000D657447|nr:RNA polymerase II subunit A C-terminal domain phosphatase isoform X1 [Tetranychus urticae]